MMLRRIAGWLLTLVGIVGGVYGAIQLGLGVVHAIRGPERGTPIALALGGLLIVGIAVLVARGGRRLLQRPLGLGRRRR